MSNRRPLIFRRIVRPELVSLYQVDAMESALADFGIQAERVHATKGRVLLSRFAKHLRCVRNVTYGPETVLVPVLRRSEGDLFPWCYHREVIPWSFDCWPAEYDAWEDFYRRIRVRLAFVSARDSAAEMQRRLPHARIVWSPEATDPARYLPEKPLADRTIDVLELGRRYDRFHDSVTPALERAGRTHLYEQVRGQKIFATREDLARGLGDAKVSVCFPASMTHPETAGGLETATHRYFESMASKCVLVGRAPAELIELFGYNPVVEVDSSDMRAQMTNILATVDEYSQLVCRNYSRLMEVGTWQQRCKEILKVIAPDN